MEFQSSPGTGQAYRDIFQDTNDEMQRCIQNCIRCHQVCLHMIQHCLGKGGAHSNPLHIRLLQDCAQICAASGDFMIRGSDLHGRTCGVCAEACVACAEDCEKFGDDEMMRNCAEVCRQCADSCQKMASQH